jgi:hypothetical protein
VYCGSRIGPRCALSSARDTGYPFLHRRGTNKIDNASITPIPA